MMKINALQANSGCQDIHSLMFLVMRQAIEEDNANKSYFVARIMEENKKSEALGDYLKELQESMVEISNKQKGQKSNDRPDVVSDGGVKRDTPPVVTYEDGQPTAKCEKISDSANPPPYTQKQIESEIKNVETAQETIRNERERFVTSFEDFENKVNQNYKLLVQFLKTYNENVKKPIQNLL